MESLTIDTAMIKTIVSLVIAWGPTILATIALLIGFFVGFKRGGRKSLILLIHAAVCFTICISVYLFLVESRDFDKFMLDTANMIIGSESGLEDMLGVSADCETIREVIIEFIPTQLSFMDGLELIARDNGAYLLTIVDMVYRIVFAILLNIIYLILIFIAYLIYLFFYSERKYKKKQNLLYQNNLRDGLYRKNSLAGGIIGLCRSFVAVTIVLSFVGSLFFVVTGGAGDEDSPTLEIENETASLVAGIYESICEYGSQGIFKVLNLVKDEKNVPYYLYAADLVFQGGLKDGDIDKNVVLREELAAYIGFARKTYELIILTGSDELLPIINGESDADLMDAMIDVMSKSEFQTKFERIIKDFEKDSYFINFALSLCESMIKNINDISLLSTLPNEIREILQICFSPEYLSPNIPYEAKLLLEKENDPFYEYQKDKYILGSLDLSKLITREDIVELLRTLFEVITYTNTSNESDSSDNTTKTLDLVSSIIDHVQNLSILSTNRANEINPVLRRLYSYLELTYLSDSSEVAVYARSADKAPYSDSKYNEVLWIEEINILINIIKEGLNVYQNNFVNISGVTEPLEIVVNMFDQNNQYYSQNIKALDYILSSLANSRILGEVLSSSYIQTLLNGVLSGVVAEYELPDDINYSNVYDYNGNIVEFGELYYVFSIVEKLVTNTEIIQKVNELLSNSENGVVKIELDTIFDFVDLMNEKGNDGLSVLDCILDSNIFKSLVSSLLVNFSKGEEAFVYLDASVMEKGENGEVLDKIKTSELETLFDLVPDIIPLAKEVLAKFETKTEEEVVPQNESTETEEKSDIEYILELLENPTILKALDSKIIEGTISALAFSYLPEDMISIPKALKLRTSGLVSSENGRSELRKLISVITDTSVDFADLLSGEIDPNDILDIIQSATQQDIKILFESDILYYTIYSYLVNTEISGISIVVPNTVKVSLTDDIFDSIVYRNQLIELVNCLLLLLPEEDPEVSPEEETNLFDPSQILLSLVLNKDRLAHNDIIVATVANLLVNTTFAEQLEILDIPTVLKKAATIEELTTKFGRDNPWYNEIHALVVALDEMLNISEKEELNFEGLEDTIINSVTTLNDDSSIEGKTKLDLLFDSAIVTNLLSVSIDAIFESMLSSDDLKSLKDYNGNYYKSEISSIIYLVNVFEITAEDLGGESSDTILNKVKNNISKLNETNDDEITHLSHLYKNKVFGMLLYNVSKELLSVPKDALIKNPSGSVVNSIKYDEANALISCIDIFGSIDDIDATAIDLALMKTKLDVISKSTIMSSFIYDMMGSSGSILIPYYTLNEGRTNDNVYINEVEFYKFLSLVTDSDVADSLFESTDGKYDLTSIKEIDFTTFSIDTLKKLTESTIINATILDLLLNTEGDSILSALTLPEIYLLDRSEMRLLVKEDNVWIANNEMSGLINLLDVLGVNDISNFDEIKDKVMEFLDSYNPDTSSESEKEQFFEKLESLYGSIVFSSSISNVLDKILSHKLIDLEIRDSLAVRDIRFIELYNYNEIKNFINSMKLLGISFSNTDNINIGIESFGTGSEAAIKRNNEIYESILVKGVVTTQINKEIDSNNIAINTHEKAYDQTLKNKYNLRLFNWSEIQVILDLLGGKALADFDINAVSPAVIRASLFDQNGNYNSYIFAATLTAKSKKNLVVIKEDLEEDGLLTPSATKALLDGIDALGLSSIQIDVDTLELPSDDTSLRMIANSNILNGTIAKRLKFTVGDRTYRPKGYNGDKIVYEIKQNSTNNNVALIEVEEFVRFGKTLSQVIGANRSSITNLNLDLLSYAEPIFANGSILMRNLLMEYLVYEYRFDMLPNINIVPETAIDLTNCSSTVVYYLHDQDIPAVLEAIAAIASQQ